MGCEQLEYIRANYRSLGYRVSSGRGAGAERFARDIVPGKLMSHSCSKYSSKISSSATIMLAYLTLKPAQNIQA